MPRYIVAAAPPRGWRKTLFVEADSSDQAVQQLRDQNWSKITLLTDDVHAAFDKAFPTQGTAALALATIRGGWHCYLAQVVYIYQHAWVVLLLCLVSLFYYPSDQFFFWMRVSLCVMPCLLPGILILVLPGYAMMRRVNRLLTHEVFGRWEAMLSVSETLGPPLPKLYQHYLKALALGGLKRLEEADAELNEVHQLNQLPEWLVLMLRTAVHLNAKNYQQVDRYIEQVKVIQPACISILLVQGIRYYLVQQDVRMAVEAVKQSLLHEVAETLLPNLYFLQGAIALEGHQLDEAASLLQKAERACQPYRYLPSIRMSLSIIRAHLALAWAKQGNHDRAVRAFAYARPVLEGREAHKLLDRCRRELGVV